MEALSITSFWKADPDLLPLHAFPKRPDWHSRSEDNRKKALLLLDQRAYKRRAEREGGEQSCASGGKVLSWKKKRRARTQLPRRQCWDGRPQWISYGPHRVRLYLRPSGTRSAARAWRITVVGPLADQSCPSTGVKTLYARDRKEAHHKISCFLSLSFGSVF